MNAPAHFERMRRRFEDAAEREHGRRAVRRVRRRRSGIAAACVAVVATGVFVALNLRNPSAEASAVRVERAGDRVSVRLVALTTDADRLAHDLAEAGIPADVGVATTGPSRVGTIVSLSVLGSRQDVVVDRGPRSFDFVVAPETRLHLDLGVPAAAGARYDVVVDATADGEPLHCRIDVGEPVAQARVTELPSGLRVEWRLDEAGQTPGPIDVAALDAAAAARLSVQVAYRLADDLVQIVVATQARAVVAAPAGCS